MTPQHGLPHGEKNLLRAPSHNRHRAAWESAANSRPLISTAFFGLHPSLRLQAEWDAKRLAIVHAAGSPDNTRSHFDAQDYMEAGTPGVKSTPDGWLNRYLQAHAQPKSSPFRGVSMTQNLPRAMQGRAPALAISNLADFSIRADNIRRRCRGFRDIYEGVANDARRHGQETFEAIAF